MFREDELELFDVCGTPDIIQPGPLLPLVDAWPDLPMNDGIGSQSVGATTFGERNCGAFSPDVPEIEKYSQLGNFKDLSNLKKFQNRTISEIF